METSVGISSPLRLQKKSSNSQVRKKYKGALTYPVGLGMLHGYTNIRNDPAWAMPAWWCGTVLARTFPLASISHCHESSWTPTTLMVSLGADPNYLEKPDRWGTHLCRDCPCGTATPCCRKVQWRSPVTASVSSSTSSPPSSTDTALHRAIQFLKYLLEPAVPEAPAPPSTYRAGNYCQPLPVTPAEALKRSPRQAGRLSLAGWPGVRSGWHWRRGLIAGSRWDPFTWLPLGRGQALRAPGKTQRVWGYFYQGCLATHYLVRFIIVGCVDAFPWAQLLGSSRSVSCFPG